MNIHMSEVKKSFINRSLLLIPLLLATSLFGMQSEQSATAIKFSPDLSLQDIQTGKKKVEAVLWDFHGILGIADKAAKEKFAAEKFPALGIESLEKLKEKYPDAAADTQKLILKGFMEIQKGALDTNPALKADFDKIPKGALGEMYGAVFRKHGYNNIAELADGLSTTYKPRPGIENIIKALSALGIKQYLGSNIAPHVYELVKRRFEQDYNNYMLDELPVGAMVDISGYGPVPASRIPQTRLVNKPKPSADFFKAYRSGAPEKVTVFIDDKERNINEAVNHGPMIGVLLDGKDPVFIDKLTEILNTLQVPVGSKL